MGFLESSTDEDLAELRRATLAEHTIISGPAPGGAHTMTSWRWLIGTPRCERGT